MPSNVYRRFGEHTVCFFVVREWKKVLFGQFTVQNNVTTEKACF